MQKTKSFTWKHLNCYLKSCLGTNVTCLQWVTVAYKFNTWSAPTWKFQPVEAWIEGASINCAVTFTSNELTNKFSTKSSLLTWILYWQCCTKKVMSQNTTNLFMNVVLLVFFNSTLLLFNVPLSCNTTFSLQLIEGEISFQFVEPT